MLLEITNELKSWFKTAQIIPSTYIEMFTLVDPFSLNIMEEYGEHIT